MLDFRTDFAGDDHLTQYVYSYIRKFVSKQGHEVTNPFAKGSRKSETYRFWVMIFFSFYVENRHYVE